VQNRTLDNFSHMGLFETSVMSRNIRWCLTAAPQTRTPQQHISRGG
jgi:hypothetical protein